MAVRMDQRLSPCAPLSHEVGEGWGRGQEVLLADHVAIFIAGPLPQPLSRTRERGANRQEAPASLQIYSL